MIYDIYGTKSTTIYEFRNADSAYDQVWAILYDNKGQKVRRRHVSEDILLETEVTDWVYTDGDHITYNGKEYPVERVAKTLHEDHAKVYIGYVEYVTDEESKQRAEADEALYKSGIDKGLSQAGVQKFGDIYSYPVCTRKSKRWYQFWR